jgi:hypothetical protein
MVAWHSRFGGGCPNGESVSPCPNPPHVHTRTGRARRREYSRPAQALTQRTRKPCSGLGILREAQQSGSLRCVPRQLYMPPRPTTRAHDRAIHATRGEGRHVSLADGAQTLGARLASEHRVQHGLGANLADRGGCQRRGRGGWWSSCRWWSRRVSTSCILAPSGRLTRMQSCSLIRMVNLPTTRGCRWRSRVTVPCLRRGATGRACGRLARPPCENLKMAAETHVNTSKADLYSHIGDPRGRWATAREAEHAGRRGHRDNRRREGAQGAEEGTQG